MQMQKRLLLGLSLASFMIQPALAADKVSLFKVVTVKDEVVIGIPDDELAQIDGKDAGGIARMLAAKGSMSAWQYAVRHSATGDLEHRAQRPRRVKIVAPAPEHVRRAPGVRWPSSKARIASKRC